MPMEQPTLGQAWNEALAKTETPSFDLPANRRAFADLQQHVENSARPVITRLVDGEIYDGIMSCIARGSNAVGLPVPAKALQTEAFDQLRLWLKAQGLAYVITDFAPDDEGIICASLSIQPVSIG